MVGVGAGKSRDEAKTYATSDLGRLVAAYVASTLDLDAEFHQTGAPQYSRADIVAALAAVAKLALTGSEEAAFDQACGMAHVAVKVLRPQAEALLNKQNRLAEHIRMALAGRIDVLRADLAARDWAPHVAGQRSVDERVAAAEAAIANVETNIDELCKRINKDEHQTQVVGDLRAEVARIKGRLTDINTAATAGQRESTTAEAVARARSLLILSQADLAYDARHFDQAVPLFQRACEAGNSSGCASLGSRYAKGESVAQDYKKAVQLWQRACDVGNGPGCFNLGLAFFNGGGVAVDKPKAAQMFQRACDAAIVRGCTNLGTLYRRGEGVVADKTKAVDLFERACDSGYPDACRALGR